MFGEPIVLEPENQARFERFLKYIDDNNLKPLLPELVDFRRWGYGIFYLFQFTLGVDTPDEKLFKEIYDVLKFRNEYVFPEYSEKIQQCLDVGGWYLNGRLDEVGH